MREYLETEPLTLPLVVDGKSKPGLGEPTPGETWVVPSFESGAVLLRAEDGGAVRLSWEDELTAENASTDRRRELAAGRYTLVGYRLIARDERKRSWHVSASALKGVTIDVLAGRENRLEIEPTIQIVERVQSDGLGVSVQGVSGAGLSIYKEGKRIPLGFRRLDGKGRVLAEGKINYG